MPPDDPIPHPDGPVVLVVDDDTRIRTLIRRVLEGDGFAVREAESGRHALSLLQEESAIGALVTDLTMADGSGGWLLAQLAYEHPRLLPHVVLVSGDPGGASAAHVAARWRCPIVPKPFTAADLVATVRRVLQPRSSVA